MNFESIFNSFKQNITYLERGWLNIDQFTYSCREEIWMLKFFFYRWFFGFFLFSLSLHKSENTVNGHDFRKKMLFKSGYEWFMNRTLCGNNQNIDMNETGAGLVFEEIFWNM